MTNVTPKKRNSPGPALFRVKKPSSLPSIDELIAESRALGMNDIAEAFEQIRYLASPKGQRALERKEKRLSRL